MSVTTIKITAGQFLGLGPDPAGIRLELVDGEIARGPSPELGHSFVVTRLSCLLLGYIDAHDLGELYGGVNTIFGDYNVRRPDLIYLAKNRLHLIGEEAMEGPPDLCVEIVSPSSASIDRDQKFKQYARGKVAHYWIVDPQAKTIEGYKLAGRKYQLAGSGKGDKTVRLPPFEKLEIPLSRLWRPAARR